MNSPKSKFDVLIIEYLPLHHCFTIIAEKFDIPIIMTCPIQAAHYIDPLFGNPSHPAAIPVGFSYIPQHMNFLQRLENAAYYIYMELMLANMISSKVDSIKQRIRDDFGIVSRKTFSLVFQNSHSSLFARPLVQNVIEIGGIHLEPNKTLPQVAVESW